MPNDSSKVKLMEGAKNNLPDNAALQAANQIAEMTSNLTDKDLLIVLVSGKVMTYLFLTWIIQGATNYVQLSFDTCSYHPQACIMYDEYLEPLVANLTESGEEVFVLSM